MAPSKTLTPERMSVALGLCIVMLATLPRYIAGGHETHQSLLLLAIVAVLAFVVIQWRLLDVKARKRLPSLLGKLALWLLLGAAIMTMWHSLMSDWFSWQLLLSHGATLGLLLHTLNLWRGVTS
ncbi:hypothetical protein QC823_05030 [Halomonas vilamensis]|uniref:Transmembrane protein n=1 Tax=Vreelandella vilamensis TaxID=531309 RepID=A0ABU1H236_9GAMM|nr:hypothetical protein [Halomonas vilamensis]MDR5898353.1 hypothetical protein [Halomonas vilamensis]